MPTPLGAALNLLATQMSAFIESTFPDECAIVSPTFSTGDYGTGAPAFAVPSTFPTGCAWGPLSARAAKEYEQAGKTKSVCQYQVTLAGAVTVKPQDRVYVKARGEEPLRVFEVKGIVRNAGLPLALLCTLEE